VDARARHRLHGSLEDATGRFWDKYKAAKLDVLALKRKARTLKEQERELRGRLNRYRDGVAVSDDVTRERNPVG